MAEETERRNSDSLEKVDGEEVQSLEDDARPGWREIFRQAFDRARRENRPTNRSGLGRDHSRSLFLLAGAAIAVLLLFLGVFSSPNRVRKSVHARPPGTPHLGQRLTRDQQSTAQAGSVTPMLSAQAGHTDAGGKNGVTAEDIDRTAGPVRSSSNSQPRLAAAAVPGKAAPYALGQVDFSDALPRERGAQSPSSAKSESDDLRKPSLVFVRSAQNTPPNSGIRATPAEAEEAPTLALPTGTKLVARLESVVTTAVKDPVVAAIEYNYERDGAIVVPAGAKAIGSLQQADRSGNVEIRFHAIQMPDGTTGKMEATAMSLTCGPLKGTVSGKKTGTNFLVRTFTGLGQAATYLVGSGGLSAPLSESAFLRDRIATNIGIAGDQELNNLTFNQNIVVTLPGNTRFYVVMENGTVRPQAQTQPAAMEQANNAPLPSADELRQLLQLRQELSAMYPQTGSGRTAAEPVPQQ